MKRKTKILLSIELEFHDYNTKAKNRKAITTIRKWIVNTVQDECRFVPMFIEKDSSGTYIEDDAMLVRARFVAGY